MKEQLQRLLKGSAIYGVGNALNQLINILLLPLFTSYLSPRDFGIVSLLSVLVFLINAVFSLGFGTSLGIKYFDKNSKENKETTIWSSFITLLIGGLIMLLICYFFREQIGQVLMNSGNFSYLLSLALFSAFFQVIVIPFVLRLQFEEKQYTYVLMTVISTIITILLNVFLIVWMKRGVSGKVEAGMISKFVFLLLFMIPSVRSLRYRFSLRMTKELLKYGLPMIPSFLSLYILQKGNIYMLELLSTKEMVGLYSIGFSFGSSIQLVVLAFTTAWVPFFMSFKNKQDKGKPIFAKTMSYYIFAVGILSLLFYVFARPVVSVFTQPSFIDSYKVIGLTSTAFSLLGVFSILLVPVYYAKDVRFSTLIQLIASVIFIVCGVFLIREFEIVGASVSLVAGYFSMCVLLQVWIRFSKRGYVFIRYEWKRIIIFTIIYSVGIIIMLTEKNLVFIYDLMFSMVIFVFTVLITYSLLTSSEKSYINERLSGVKTYLKLK